MSLMLLALLSIVLTVGLAVVVLAVVLMDRQDQAPAMRTPWLGPSATDVETAVAREVERRRSDSGLQTLAPHAAVVELARHHAFDMATRNFCGDANPDGSDVEDRRRRLHPGFVGELRQWSALREADPAAHADGVAASLLRACGDMPELGEERWSVLGAGVAIEAGRCACCLVAGSHWATLDDRLLGPVPPGGWTVEGTLEPGTTAAQLAIRAAGSPDLQRAAVPVADEGEGRFQLHLDVEPGSGERLEIVKGGAVGLRRRA